MKITSSGAAAALAATKASATVGYADSWCKVFGVRCKVFRTDGESRIADGLIEGAKFVELGEFFVSKQINLIKNKYRAYAVGLAGSEETVYEGGTGDRMVDGNDEGYLIDIRR